MNKVRDRSSTTANSLHRLCPLSWTHGILAILGGLIVSFFLFGFWMPYWRIADQDILMIHDAFLQNQGLPRMVTIHPAHLSVLALSGIFRLLHRLGFLSAYSLSTLPPASDVNAYNRAWTDVVHVARLVSLSIGLVYVLAFGFLLRRLVQDWRVATLGMFAIAYSGGIAMSIRSVKNELLSGSLVAIALLILLIAARLPRLTARPLLIGAAALIATLAMDNKVQAIFLITAFPVLLLPFGELSDRNGYWSQWRAGWALAGLAALALLAAAAAAPLVLQGLFPDVATRATAHPVFGATSVFPALLAVWIGLGLLAFTLVWRVPVAEGLASAMAIVGGVAFGLLPLYIYRETSVVTTVINPIDALYIAVSRYLHAPGPVTQCGPAGCGLPFALLFHSFWGMVRHHSFFLDTSPRPEIFLEWSMIAGIVFVFRRGEHKVALQAAFLIATALGIDTLQAARALKQDYFNYTDPIIIIAAVVLLANARMLQYHRWTYPIGVALIGLHIVLSQAEPFKHALLLRSGPETKCSILKNLGQADLERFSFCRTWRPPPNPNHHI
jgi:hypothetical protein